MQDICATEGPKASDKRASRSSRISQLILLISSPLLRCGRNINALCMIAIRIRSTFLRWILLAVILKLYSSWYGKHSQLCHYDVIAAECWPAFENDEYSVSDTSGEMFEKCGLDSGLGGINLPDLDWHVQWLCSLSTSRIVEWEHSHHDTHGAIHGTSAQQFLVLKFNLKTYIRATRLSWTMPLGHYCGSMEENRGRQRGLVTGRYSLCRFVD